MDIDIDAALVRSITGQEYALATAEIAAEGPVRALEHSQQRHDARLAAAPDAATLACQVGCSWCCYFTVDVRPAEVVRILDFMRQQLTPQEQQRIHEEIEVNSAILQPLDELERTRRNVKCPFLASGRCTIYAARPQTCRNYHATSAAGCRKSFEEPDNLDIDPEFAPLVYQAGSAHVDAFSKAMRDAGYDTAAYELNTALAVALTRPGAARGRFAAKERLFVELQGTEVPLQVMEEIDSPS